jgi:hypothetical protein
VAPGLILEEEVREMVGARRFERQAARSDHRNGTYLRGLMTSIRRRPDHRGPRRRCSGAPSTPLHEAWNPAGDRTAPAPDPDAVARFLAKVLEIAETAPKRTGLSLSRSLVPMTLVPVRDPDGTRRYEARGALNTNPAALSDGRVSVNGGCGGGI